ncbi:hypothetical protein GCM10010123_27130 [Pilimelia anulata]|uniref:Roadblock/LC7 domain-containing protein n=1 Tax=Pilimelia anulata TaxID=53371 RepID=A0A8J3BD56_9ACTN|nr:hypothetical protein [Pilimelia anulata]GGJ95811.1 hypothetical protein GCM10010123_27130 [Pilimelia anulata]
MSVEAYLNHAMTIPGARGASIVDYGAGTCLGTTGAAPDDHAAAAAGASEVMAAVTRTAPFTSATREDAMEDLIITSRSGYHLLRRLSTGFDARLVLYLWLDRDRGNLAVARRRLRELGAHPARA